MKDIQHYFFFPLGFNSKDNRNCLKPKLPVPGERITIKYPQARGVHSADERTKSPPSVLKISEFLSLLLDRKELEVNRVGHSRQRAHCYMTSILGFITQGKKITHTVVLSLKTLHKICSILCFTLNTCCQNLNITAFY